MPGPHDIGGRNLGPINFIEKEKSSLDKRIDILQRLIGWVGAKVYRVDELRFKIEGLSKEDYTKFKYYEKWLYAIYNLLVDKDVLTDREIKEKISSYKNEEKKNF